ARAVPAARPGVGPGQRLPADGVPLHGDVPRPRGPGRQGEGPPGVRRGGPPPRPLPQGGRRGRGRLGQLGRLADRAGGGGGGGEGWGWGALTVGGGRGGSPFCYRSSFFGSPLPSRWGSLCGSKRKKKAKGATPAALPRAPAAGGGSYETARGGGVEVV